jgi:very-short-patch-repair endonuclease
VPDLRRQNTLVNAGFHVLRFTAADLHVRGSVAAQVRRARDLLRRRAR